MLKNRHFGVKPNGKDINLSWALESLVFLNLLEYFLNFLENSVNVISLGFLGFLGTPCETLMDFLGWWYAPLWQYSLGHAEAIVN